MKAPRFVPAAILLMSACMAVVSGLPLWADEPPSPGASQPLRFLRVYAPADRLKDWPWGNVRYLPVRPDEFERLVNAASLDPRSGRASVAATIRSAQYRAKLVGDDLVQGTATLDIQLSGEVAAMLPLAPCRLPIAQATWAGPTRQPARLGLSLDGRLEVLVERSGQLQLDWSLRGRRDNWGVVAFPMELPSCPATQMILELPPQMVPVAEPGVVVQEGGRGGATVTWRVNLGGHERFELRVAPSDQASRRRQMPIVRESLVYDMSSHGAEILAQLQIDVPSEPVRQLALTLDPGVQLITARCGDSPLEWATASIHAAGQSSRVVLEFPEPIRGTGRVLRLGALAPVQTGQRWQLPRIRPEGVFWQEGNATLLVTLPLVVEQLTPLRARQTRTAPLPSPRSGESLDLQYFAPDATAEIVLGEPQSPLGVDTGVALEFGRGEISGKVVASLSVPAGERFHVAADVSRHWIVDSVECVPAEALDDWTFQRAQSRPGILQIQLAKAISPTRPLRLILSVRRLNVSPGQTLGIDDLTPLRFHARLGGRRLVAVRAAEPYRLKWRGDERLPRPKPQELEPGATGLFTETPRELVFENDPAASALRVSLESPKPSYSATIRVDAMAYGRFLTEAYWFRCVPEGASVSRLVVHFSARRNVPLQWALASGDQDQLTARRLSPPQNVANDGRRGETWEINLGRPRTSPFELRANRAGLLIGQQSLSLASVPEAGSQRGSLVIRSAGATTVGIRSNRLKPILPEPVPDGQYQTAQAAYSYDPARDVDIASEAAPAVSAMADPSGPPTSWVWDCQLQSRYETDGTGHHQAIYRLQTAGDQQLRLAFPEAVQRIQGVWADNTSASWQRPDEQDKSRVAIDLPTGRRFPVVCIHFTTTDRRLQPIDTLAPPLPVADVPMLAQHWTVWLPPGYESASVDPRWQSRYGRPVTWRESVFGPLGRGPDSPPFAPFDAAAWSGLVLPDPLSQSAEGKAARWLQQVGRLAARIGAAPNAKPLDWGALLTDKTLEIVLDDITNDAPAIALLADRQAFRRLGIVPRGAAPQPTGDTDMARGIALFRRSGLVLLVHPDAILVTSATNAAPWRHRCLAPTRNDLLWSVKPGPLADQIRAAMEEEQDASFLPIATWARAPAEPREPWNLWQPEETDSLGTLGWTVSHVELSGATQTSLSLVHRDTIQAFRWIAFLALFALGWWKGGSRPTVWIVAAGLAACASLLLPEGYAAIASGAFLGILGQWGLRVAFWREKPGDSTVVRLPQRPSTASRLAAPAGMIIFLIAAAICCATARGEDQSPSSVPRPPAPSVFIPIDEKQRPTGDKVYVPEDLFGELQRRAAKRVDEPQGWLLAGGVYRGTLSWQTNPDRLVLADLKATYDLQVFNRPSQIRIPLGNQAADFATGAVSLDGRTVTSDWRQGAVEIRDVPEPGLYRLDIALHPSALSGSGSGFEIKVPRLATARLELSVPADAPSIEVPSSLGTVTLLAEPPRLTAELGPSERLAVRWQEGAAHGAGRPALDVEQLLWLKVQPGAVVLEARLKFKAVQGQVSQVQLTADPRLRLLRSLPADGSIVPLRVAPGQPQVLRLGLARPVGEQTVVDLAFLLTGASGVGNLRLPTLVVSEAHTTRRWLAVSVDPALQANQQASDRLEAVAVPVFVGAWGAAEIQPQFVHSLGPGEPLWSLSTRPSEPRTTADQNLTLSIGEGEARVLFDARLVVSGGANFQYRLSAPPEFTPESVSLTEAGSERVARWSRDKQGNLVVFLSGPVTGKHDLTLRGRMPAPARPGPPLGLVRLEGVELQSSQVQLFREPSVDVKIEGVTGLTEVESPTVDESKAHLGRLLKCWSVDARTPPAAEKTPAPAAPASAAADPGASSPPAGSSTGPGAAKPKPDGSAQASPAKARPSTTAADAKPAVSPATAPARRPTADSARKSQEPSVRITWRLNHPQVHFDQITALRCIGDTWDVQTDLRIRVSEGVLDEIHLEVPSQWSGPYKVTPASPVRTVAPLTTGAARELIIRPRLAVEGELRFSIVGPLTLAVGERVSAPNIVLRGAQAGKRFLVLPTQSQLQPITWETQGLREAQLPSDFAAPPVGREALVTYEVRGEPHRAVLKALEQAQRSVQVHLADISLAWRSDGTCYGLAAFDLAPSELAQCHLRLPAGMRPVQVTASGLLSPPSYIDQNRWLITLNSNGLPQHIEVLFEGSLSERMGFGTVPLEPPALDGLPVRQTLWTVSSPALFEAEPSAAVPAVDQLQHDWTRLESITALIEQGADLTGKEPEETLRWYRAAIHRWAAVRHEVDRLLQTARSDVAQSIQTELQSIDRKQWRIANRLGAVQVLSQEFAETSAAGGATQLWQWTAAQRPTIRCIAPGAGTPLLLDCRPVETGRLSRGLWTAAAVLLITAIVLMAWRLDILRTVFLRWPLVAGLLAGIAWWLWLKPSIVGLAVIAWCLLFLLRSAWRRYRRPHSVIVPVGPSSSV